MGIEGAMTVAEMEDRATSQGMQAPSQGWIEKKTGFLTAPDKGK